MIECGEVMELDDERRSSAEVLIKSRLKKLSKLVINRRMIRLGTDLEG
jgi:hypothetical protein